MLASCSHLAQGSDEHVLEVIAANLCRVIICANVVLGCKHLDAQQNDAVVRHRNPNPDECQQEASCCEVAIEQHLLHGCCYPRSQLLEMLNNSWPSGLVRPAHASCQDIHTAGRYDP